MSSFEFPHARRPLAAAPSRSGGQWAARLVSKEFFSQPPLLVFGALLLQETVHKHKIFLTLICYGDAFVTKENHFFARWDALY